MTAKQKTAYSTVCLVWQSDTTCIPIPILSVHASAEEAEQNARMVFAQLALQPDFVAALTDKPITITPVAIDAQTLKEFLENVQSAVL
jgi:hypothetical protein